MHTRTIPQFQTGKEVELNREPSRVSNQPSDAVGEGGSPSLTKRDAAECMLIHERKLSLYAARSVDL